jgi:hypothetical protein
MNAGLKSSYGAQMAISSQTLKEILQITEAFKSQLFDRLDGFVDGLNDSFRSIQD